MLIGLKKLISLANFYLISLNSFFKVKWNKNIFIEFITRALYYLSNWCYVMFLTLFEGIVFILHRDLIKIETKLYNNYFKLNQFYISLRDGLTILPDNLPVLTYGETSWFAINNILKTVNASNKDIFYDLGCGTGRNLFFARIYYGVKKAVGIDLIPTFIEIGNNIVKDASLEGIIFIQSDIFNASLKDGNIYLAVVTVCYNNLLIEQLKEKFKEIPIDSWVITVSTPLVCEHLKLVKVKTLPYSWGFAKTYFHKRI